MQLIMTEKDRYLEHTERLLEETEKDELFVKAQSYTEFPITLRVGALRESARVVGDTQETLLEAADALKELVAWLGEIACDGEKMKYAERVVKDLKEKGLV